MNLAKRKPRLRRNNESNRREELLRVSARLFREKGFDGTTIRAADCGVNARARRRASSRSRAFFSCSNSLIVFRTRLHASGPRSMNVS